MESVRSSFFSAGFGRVSSGLITLVVEPMRGLWTWSTKGPLRLIQCEVFFDHSVFGRGPTPIFCGELLVIPDLDLRLESGPILDRKFVAPMFPASTG